ncbi:MAG: GAF domain-containing protein, partial [Roseiflexaceae bacterium]|nr:GAF domain-containing protein [Roseiflexaceae bacterium]
LLSLWLVLRSYLLTHDDLAERHRRRFFAIAVLIAVSGAFLASAAREFGFSQFIGHALMDAGLAMMAYMVLAQRLLLPARVARRTFVRSLLGGGSTALLILLIMGGEPLVGRLLGVDTPLLTVFALVTLLAIFGPARDIVGAWLDQRFFHREFDYGQLLRAVSNDLFERGDLAGQLEAALGAICRTLQVRSGAVAVREAAGLRVLASYGSEPVAADAFRQVADLDVAELHHGAWAAWPLARLLLPLRRGEQTLGLLALGPKRSDEPYGEVERVLLDSLGRYLALAIAHARTQQEEELAMAVLAEQSRQLQAEQAALEVQAQQARQMLQAAPAVAPVSALLRVAALGPLHVERDGARIERWGGDKAGNYQAEGLFAFLFDRRGKGLTKDEAEELIWPDLVIEKADVAFHRTLGALRRTLEPGLRRGNESKLITYHHERYWLAPQALGWCDLDEYTRAAERGHTALRQRELASARACFEQAAALYRGDYLDDCPFYGDSAAVEERRNQLRQQQAAVLLGLGSAYEQLGMVGEAATAYRGALTASQDDCTKADDALERLAA